MNHDDLKGKSKKPMVVQLSASQSLWFHARTPQESHRYTSAQNSKQKTVREIKCKSTTIEKFILKFKILMFFLVKSHMFMVKSHMFADEIPGFMAKSSCSLVNSPKNHGWNLTQKIPWLMFFCFLLGPNKSPKQLSGPPVGQHPHKPRSCLHGLGGLLWHHLGLWYWL